MDLTIDFAIVIIFLFLTLAVGCVHGRKIKTIKDYALGGRDFSTAALIATLTATYASGSGFFITLSKTYSSGLSYLLASFGTGFSLIITSLFLVPRMGEFLGKISIAEAMGDLYGNKVRFITAISATIGSAGFVAVQFKAFGNVVSYFIGLPSSWAIIISGVIVTIYSAFGGIRAVTFTDILQFFTFGVIIPILGFIIWNSFYYTGHTLEQAFSDPKFDVSLLYNDPDSLWQFAILFLYFSTPTPTASFFQRVAMGKTIQQVKKVFWFSAILLMMIKLTMAWIPFLVYHINPNLDPNQLLGYIVDTYSFTGLRGLIIIAIIAFAMSTADSMINSSAVLFTHDIYGLFKKDNKNEILVSRIFACVLGFGTIILSLVETDLLGILVYANSFYSPIVIPPLLLTIFGFRSSGLSVLIAMIAGLIATLSWKLLPAGFVTSFQDIVGMYAAMACNALFLMLSHYLLRQPGGWVGIKDKSYFIQSKLNRKNLVDRFHQWCSEVNFTEYCEKIAPKTETTYVIFGIYAIMCTFTTMYSTQVELLGDNSMLTLTIYQIMVVTSTLIAIYPLWPLTIARSIKQMIMNIWWPIAIFYMLIFFSCFFVMVSKFSTLQVALFCINTMLAALLLGWRLAIPAIIGGFYFSVQFYRYFFGDADFILRFGSPEFILIYITLFLGSVITLFIKPGQEYLEETEARVDVLVSEVTDLGHQNENLDQEVCQLNEKVAHYSERVADQATEIERLGATAQRILNNVNHELRLPVGNVVNFAEMLHEGVGKLTQDQMKMMSEEVYKNSTKLSSMILNMLDLAMLSAKKIELRRKTINLGDLVEDRVKTCRAVYLRGKKIDFRLVIEPELLIAVDPNYIRQVVDNIIINSINYSDKGLVEVVVKTEGDNAILSISDEGIGISPLEIYDIFRPFKMGKNAESSAEGRGVGLALCKTAIEAHGGSIKAESDGINGAKFICSIPVLPRNMW